METYHSQKLGILGFVLPALKYKPEDVLQESASSQELLNHREVWD